MDRLSWILLGLGVVLGIAILFVFVFRFGRSFMKHMDLDDRGPWDRPVPQPIPKDTPIAVYKRRKRYHRHHRHHYQRRRSRPK
jgi:hypothetical protein